MPYSTTEVGSIEEARALASIGGSYLVLDWSTLQQIEAAEVSGAFQGGMTGNSEGAPYSAEGYSGEQISPSSDPSPSIDLSDLEGVMTISIDGMVETVMDLAEVAETAAGKLTGPIILVPTSELQKWLNGPSPSGGGA